jgi:SAM-dependent methyltransferase
MSTVQKPPIQPNIQSAYDEQYTSELITWRELGGKYKASNIVELCRSLEVKKVLEVGAGEGSILKYLNDWNFCEELHALEISRSAVEFIRQRDLPLVKTIQQFDGYTIPFPENAFDLVILSHVIEHVEFPRLLLREIRHVSRYAIIEIPCDFSLDVDQHVEHFLSYGHINIFVPTVLRFILKSEGFEVIADKLSLQAKEVLAYNLFVNQKRPRTLISALKLQYRLLRKNLRFHFSSSSKKQLCADTYTVLCRKTDTQLSIF